jgi:calcineurin-like phosphoesterase family protein
MLNNRLGELDLPVTIIAGAGDKMVFPGPQSERLHKALPGSRLHMIEGAGHMVHYTATDAVAGCDRGGRPGRVIFFTSDTHFGDHRVLNIGKRPFADVAEMDRALTANWNAAVGPGDEVWHLGDVARRAGDTAGAAGRLQGRKHLVRGNNDPPGTVAAPGWASVQDYAELEVDGRRLVLCHYAFRSWNGAGRGAINLHGHSHGRLRPFPRQYDVGVDARDFRPVELDQLTRA